MTVNHRTEETQTLIADYQDDPALQMFQRQLHRFRGDGDCAYERALGQLYQKLFEQRLRQLSALRSAGL